MSIKEQRRNQNEDFGLTNTFALLRVEFRLGVSHHKSQLKMCKRSAYLLHSVNAAQLHE